VVERLGYQEQPWILAIRFAWKWFCFHWAGTHLRALVDVALQRQLSLAAM